jgi:hypothetical protein
MPRPRATPKQKHAAIDPRSSSHPESDLAAHPEIGTQATFKVAGSNSQFWSRVSDRNASAAAGLTVVALADLEQEPCAGALFAKHLPHGRASRFVLRLAVRMLESWLLADTDNIAKFLGAPANKIPRKPDALDHPKREIVTLARRHSPQALRRDLVPELGHTGIVGPGDRPRMEDFILTRWRPQAARKRSASLHRALVALETLATNGGQHEHVPNFIIRLESEAERYVIMETKGCDPLEDVKRAAAERWCAAVNAASGHGEWSCTLARKPEQVRALTS